MVVPPPQQMAAGPAPTAGSVAAPPKPSSGLAVTALILGICGVLPCLGIPTALAGIVLGIVALAKHRPGKGLAIGGIATGALALLLIQPLMVAILLPALARGREMAKQAKCQAQLNSVGVAIASYRGGYAGAAPADLQMVVDDGLLSAEVLECPSEPTSGNVDYFYFPLPAGAPGNALMACGWKANHSGEGRNALSASGRAKWLTEADFQAELAKPHNAAFAEALAEAEGP